MSSSKIKTCPLCGKQLRARGYYGHLIMFHLVVRPKCGKCGIAGALVYWSEPNRKFVFRCPLCHRYLGPATMDEAMTLPAIEGDYPDLEKLRIKWALEET